MNILKMFIKIKPRKLLKRTRHRIALSDANCTLRTSLTLEKALPGAAF